MSRVETLVCPHCGAPLELLPDHTCRWCRSVIADTSGLNRLILTQAEAEVLRAEAFHRVMRRWTLRPQGPPIDWDGPPDSPTANLNGPLRDLVWILRDGMGQPVIGEVAGVEVLDRQFCRLVSGAMVGGGMPKLCGVVMAVVLGAGTNPQWAAAAATVADAAKRQLVIQGSWKRGQDYQAAIMLKPPFAADDLRYPGLKELDAWVESKFAAVGQSHKRWRKP